MKKKFREKGGGHKKIHVAFRGGYQNVHVSLPGGEGGSKLFKKQLHSLWMTPIVIRKVGLVCSFFIRETSKKIRKSTFRVINFSVERTFFT